jgi:predicted transport protein
VALFRIQSGAAEKVFPLPAHPDKERGLQRLIEANLEPLFGVRFVATEFATGQKHRGRIDTLGLDQDGSPVIVEYKLTSHDNVMNQGLFYLDWLMDHRGDFEMAARSRLGEAEVTWGAPRLILLASTFSRYDQYAVNRIDERIELWTYTLYEGGLLSVELLSSEEVPSPRAKETQVARSPRKPRALPSHEPLTTGKDTYDLKHHLLKMSPTTQALFELLKEGILDLGDDVTERFMNQYIGYRRLKNFCEVVGLRSKLNVFIDGPIIDEHGIGEDMTNKGHWGTGNLRTEVASEDDIAPVMDLIAQAYALQE